MKDKLAQVRLRDIENSEYPYAKRFELIAQNKFIGKTLLPVHFSFNRRGESITLPQFISVVSSKPAIEASCELDLSTKTIRTNIPIAVACIRDIYHLNIPLSLDDKNSRKVERTIEQYRNYEIYKKLIHSEAFKSEEPFLNKLTIGNPEYRVENLLNCIRQILKWTPGIGPYVKIVF